MKKQYGIKDLPSNEISSAFIYNLESFLKYESDLKVELVINYLGAEPQR
ncbi:MAG: hypothetical protein RLZZ540_2347 [Bacteroidota bacterium]|jgi:hypothetical protein